MGRIFAIMIAVVIIAMSIILLIVVMIVINSICISNATAMMLITIDMAMNLTLAYDLTYMLIVIIAGINSIS